MPIHNVALAVGRYKPEAFWDYSLQLFKDAEEIWTDNLNDLNPADFNKVLVEHAHKYTGVEKSLIANYLGEKEASLKMADLKYFVRYHRTVGVHMTPTVAINGIICANIESSTDLEKVVDIIKQQTL